MVYKKVEEASAEAPAEGEAQPKSEGGADAKAPAEKGNSGAEGPMDEVNDRLSITSEDAIEEHSSSDDASCFDEATRMKQCIRKRISHFLLSKEEGEKAAAEGGAEGEVLA